MDAGAVRNVRSFQRSVTQRIGVLRDEYLARGRSLGASRVLWEIGPDGSDARSLRTRLDLDSGYLSRLLRSLEREGLVETAPDPSDKRVQAVRLTDTGLTERAVLDHHSDRVAWSLLAPLNETQRARLVEAMGVVERLLTAGLVEITVENPAGAAAQHCLRSYFAELEVRFENGFDPGQISPAEAAEMTEPAGLFLVGRLREEPVACGGLKIHGQEPAVVKRMWVAPAVRGLGVGRRLLAELEDHARQRGVGTLGLETNRVLTEAIKLYQAAGYVEVDPFNDELYAHHWFEKQLGPEPARRRCSSAAATWR